MISRGSFLNQVSVMEGVKVSFPAPSHEVKSEALEKDRKNTKAGNDQGSS